MTFGINEKADNLAKVLLQIKQDLLYGSYENSIDKIDKVLKQNNYPLEIWDDEEE